MSNSNNTNGNASKAWLAGGWISTAGLLALIVGLLFWRSFTPDFVHFSNDGPLGMQTYVDAHLPEGFTGMWGDINAVGGGSVWPLNISSLVNMLMGANVYARFFAPLVIFLVGLGAWAFFRALKLSALAANLGAIAAMLNSYFFTSACWGVGSQELAVCTNFLALALVVANTPETPAFTRWLRLALAGLCVGVNVMEAVDIGALFSLFIAAFVFYRALVTNEKPLVQKVASGMVQVGVIAALAGFLAYQTFTVFAGPQTKGAASAGQETESQSQKWDWGTQWSMPKQETLGLFVPGLFGYRMDTPKDMMPEFQELYRGANYWGGVGRDPNIDRYFDSGGQTSPGGHMRFVGSGTYCGIFVTLVAIWAMVQSFRRQNSPFTGAQKKLIWFWFAVIAVTLPLSWGRFAPFHLANVYEWIYFHVPHLSSIRNPAKFLYPFSWGLVILFGYGVHALSRQMNPATPSSAGITSQLSLWWAHAEKFDRRWVFACVSLFVVGVLAFLAFLMCKPGLLKYLKKVGFGDDNSANLIANYSFWQAGLFLPLLAIAILLLLLANAGCFTGSRARFGAWLLGAFLVFDLVRGDLPYVVHWDYKQKYEVGSLNPVVDFLTKKPNEYRVAKLLPHPLPTPDQFELFDQLYGIEWTQHLFPYYNIQSFDVIQMPREAGDWHAYQAAFRLGIKQDAHGQFMLDPETFPLLTRIWELSNTRYLLGPAAYVDLFNAQFDPGKARFRIAQRFSVALKPGVPEFHQRLEELTAYLNDNGEYALIEFTGALPRAKLYSTWETISPAETKNFSTNGFTAKEMELFNSAGTNGLLSLKTLASPAFDPNKTLFIDTPPKDLPAAATNENSGTVEYKNYEATHFELQASAKSPSVLLVNDKYDPTWHVTVDGKPAELFRANFIMRGVVIPPGEHSVVFQLRMDHKPLYVTIAALSLGVVLSAALWFTTRRKIAA